MQPLRAVTMEVELGRCLAVAVAAWFGAPAAFAHHSAAMFDTSKEVVLEGTVTKYDWKNPHVYMALQVRADDGSLYEQPIEAGASAVLLPLGLTPGAVTVGERVTIKGNPSRRGPRQIALGRELVKADGSVLPLNISSAASRQAPADVKAASLEGTWFSPRQGFFAYGAGRQAWQITDQARAAVARYDSRQTAHADCIPVTAPTLMLYPVTTVVDVEPDRVTFKVDWMASERIVYLDGREHPANGDRTLHGHSIGHWEGDTLVVDTVQFADHKEGNAVGFPSGAQKHLVERFSLADEGRKLRYEIVLEDAEYLAAPVHYAADWDYRPDLAPTGVPCDLDVARRFLTEE